MNSKPKSKTSDSIQTLAAVLLAIGIIAGLMVGYLGENWYAGIAIVIAFAINFFLLYYWGKSVRVHEDNRDFLQATYELLRTRIKDESK